MLDIESAIRLRAYELWQAEGERPGFALDHWLKAEAEIKGLFTPDKKPSKSQVRKPVAKAKAKA